MLKEPWRIMLFGTLEVRGSGQVITRFRTQKTGHLLAYLALDPSKPHSRGELLELFWPDGEWESRQAQLRVAIGSLRGLLEPTGVPLGAVLVSDRLNVRLNSDAFTTEVADFEAFLRRAEKAGSDAERERLLVQALCHTPFGDE